MSRLPRVNGQQILKALQKVGFKLVRVRGSHHFMRHADGRATLVPVHGTEIVGPGLLIKILKDAEIERDAFEELL